MSPIKYYGDVARVEFLIPTYLAKWLEHRSSLKKYSVEKTIKEIILLHYEGSKKAAK